MDGGRKRGAETGAGDAVGLCRRCAHAERLHNARGSAFWLCREADRDASLRRYPPLPVRACHAHAPGEPTTRGGD